MRLGQSGPKSAARLTSATQPCLPNGCSVRRRPSAIGDIDDRCGSKAGGPSMRCRGPDRSMTAWACTEASLSTLSRHSRSPEAARRPSLGATRFASRKLTLVVTGIRPIAGIPICAINQTPKTATAESLRAQPNNELKAPALWTGRCRWVLNVFSLLVFAIGIECRELREDVRHEVHEDERPLRQKSVSHIDHLDRDERGRIVG